MKTYSVRPCAIDAPDWSQAVELPDFTFPWEATEPPPTLFRALASDERLHFRFDCVDHDLVLSDVEHPRERVIGSDRVELFATPELTLDPYYCWEIDVRGEVLAYRCQTYRRYDWAWQHEGLVVASGIEGSRYWVEASLPLDLLRALDVLLPGSRSFYAGLYRAEFSHLPDGSVHQGWLPWVDPHTEKPDFHVPGSFGRFELDG